MNNDIDIEEFDKMIKEYFGDWQYFDTKQKIDTQIEVLHEFLENKIE